MVEEILVVCYCNNNQISYKQEYSGQSSTYTISLEAEISQPCQIAAKKKHVTRGILHFLSEEDIMWVVKDSTSNIFHSYMVQAQDPYLLHTSFYFYKKCLQIVSSNVYLYVNGRPY